MRRLQAGGAVTYGFHELEGACGLKFESVAIQTFCDLHGLDGIAFVLHVYLHRHTWCWTDVVEGWCVLLLARGDLSRWLLGSCLGSCLWVCL